MKGLSVEKVVNEEFIIFFPGISRIFSLIALFCGKCGSVLPTKFL
jgi:hypothetical protein